MRTHTLSHTSDKVLWQVVSKPFHTRLEAQHWRDFCETHYVEENPKGLHKFFVIETDFAHLLP